MKNVLDKIRKTVKEHNMIQPGDSIVVGLSGGPDSVCLVHGLWTLKDELQIGGLCPVHINHGLRGAESDGDQEYAMRFCESLGAELRVFRFDVAAEAAAAGVGTEDAGRRLRYQAFEKVKNETGSQRIAVAHNYNDQAETVLMSIMRGTGIAGLSGITYKRDDGVIIRPILDLKRSEIEDYCQKAGLAPRIDSSNKETIYTRNKIRLDLIPAISREFNPNIERALVRLSKQAAEDNDFIQQAAEKYITGSPSVVCDGSVDAIKGRFDAEKKCLDISGFSELHLSVAKRVVMTCASYCGLEYNISSAHLDGVMSIIASGVEAKETDLSQGWYARLSYGQLWFAQREKADELIDTPVDFPFEDILIDGYAEITAGGKTIRLGLETAGSPAGGDREVSEVRAVLDFDKLLQRKNAVFRNRMPGDRISPKGMEGSKKLQDYFTDRKIPKHMRDKMLLLVDGGKVLLAGGETAGECCKSADTGRILSIEY